ncbi:MAG: sugar-binding protein [Anaerolineales bacterium]|jgi:hypothetical protein
MRRWITRFLLLGLLITISGCTLPGAASPTPFTFPTPNLTHTAIFAATATGTEPPPTLPPLSESSTPTPLLSIITSTPDGTQDTATPGPSLTPVPTSTDRRPNGELITAAYLSTPPTIDGSLGEWTTTTYRAENVLSYASAGWTGGSDLSADFLIGWDATYLYLGVRRFDDTFVQVSTGRYMYRGDDVEIQLDLDLEGDYSSTLVSSDDYQIGFSPGNFDGLQPEAYRWFPRSVEGTLASVDVETEKSSNGYSLEVRIPWTVFGHTPSENERFGFALSLSDNDLVGVSDWQSMVSSVSTRRVANPTTWGTLVLEAPTAK